MRRLLIGCLRAFFGVLPKKLRLCQFLAAETSRLALRSCRIGSWDPALVKVYQVFLIVCTMFEGGRHCETTDSKKEIRISVGLVVPLHTKEGGCFAVRECIEPRWRYRAAPPEKEAQAGVMVGNRSARVVRHAWWFPGHVCMCRLGDFTASDKQSVFLLRTNRQKRSKKRLLTMRSGASRPSQLYD
jgi:hypothetical protein